MKNLNIMHLIICILSLFFSLSSFSEVMIKGQKKDKILITHPSTEPWEVGSKVCFTESDGQSVISCGTITRVNNQSALVKLPKVIRKLRDGDRVQRYEWLYSKKHRLTFGMDAGFDFYWPFLHYQFFFSKSLSVGLKPMYVKYTLDNVQVSGYGGTLSLNFYPEDMLFPGAWLQLAGGLYRVKIFPQEIGGFQEEKQTPIALATFGWRGEFGSSFTVGIAAGIQYANLKHIQRQLEFDGIEPTIEIDFGLFF